MAENNPTSTPIPIITPAAKKTAELASWGLGKMQAGAAALNRSKVIDGALVGLKNDVPSDEDIVSNYRWTTSKTNRDDIPYIRLREYRANETFIQKQLNLYSQLLPDRIGNAVGVEKQGTSALEPYKEIFPKNDPTGRSYKFPYFSKTSLELTTPNWEQIEGAGDAIKESASQFAGMFGETSGKIAGGISGTIDAAVEASKIAMKAQYPIVGAFDRPRIFTSHSERTITITFPLFNTVDESDWGKNRSLVFTLLEQNLYNKRDYTTGLPPVFYDVYVPGQYFCFASCMTNIQVENLGNQRLIDGQYIIPDAYQVTLTLSEMTMPSRNQLAAVFSGEATDLVTTSMI